MNGNNRKTTRRAVMTGLAAVPLAGVPAVAGASQAAADPIFEAFAAFERAKAAEHIAWEACEDASEAAQAERDAAGLRRSDIPVKWMIDAEHYLRLSRHEYEAALAALKADEREYQKISRPALEADEAARAAAEVAGAAERELLETAPTSRAGALRLLRHLADFLDEDDVVNDTNVDDVVGDAIRNAIAFFESEAQS